MQQCLARRWVTALDYLAHLSGQQLQVVVAERLTIVLFLGAQLLAPRPAQPLGQLIDPRAAGALWHRPLLEGAEVTVKRLAGAVQFTLDLRQLGLALGALGVDFGERCADRLANQRLAFEHPEQLFEDRVLSSSSAGTRSASGSPLRATGSLPCRICSVRRS